MPYDRLRLSMSVNYCKMFEAPYAIFEINPVKLDIINALYF